MNQSTKSDQDFVKGLWGIRYQVKDVSRSVNFYTQLGFKLDRLCTKSSFDSVSRRSAPEEHHVYSLAF